MPMPPAREHEHARYLLTDIGDVRLRLANILSSAHICHMPSAHVYATRDVLQRSSYLPTIRHTIILIRS